MKRLMTKLAEAKLSVRKKQLQFMLKSRCHKTDEPIYITKDGYGDMVLMSIELYESTQKKLKMYSELELSEQQIKNGKVKDARTALSSIREKYDL